MAKLSASFPNGLTVVELKEIIKDWPDYNERGEPSEVWIGNDAGLSNQAKIIFPLNSTDLLLE